MHKLQIKRRKFSYRTRSIVSPQGVGLRLTHLLMIGSGVGSLSRSTVRLGGDTLQSLPPPHDGWAWGFGHELQHDIFTIFYFFFWLRLMEIKVFC